MRSRERTRGLELSSRVPAAHQGRSILDYLALRFPYHERQRWRELLAGGRVRCNGRRVPEGFALRAGDRVSYLRLEPEPPVDGNLRVVFEDSDLVVADKPAHLPCHADGAFVTHTLVWLLAQRLATGGRRERLRLVHRLDRETSGLLVVARTGVAHRELTAQLAAGRFDKEYLAAVHGALAPARLVVDLPIGTAPDSKVSLRRAAVSPDTPGAKPARTRLLVEQRLRGATLLRAVPETGRTHQIRVHLEALGHPVVGDKLYGRSDEEYLDFVRRVKAGTHPAEIPGPAAGRQLLHSAALAFRHPRTGRLLRFSSELPPEFRAFVAARTERPGR